MTKVEDNYSLNNGASCAEIDPERIRNFRYLINFNLECFFFTFCVGIDNFHGKRQCVGVRMFCNVCHCCNAVP